MMIPGTLALLCMASLAVLIRTGWFYGLEEELGMGRRVLFLWLLVQIALSESVLPLTPFLQVQPGMFLLFPFLIRVVMKTEETDLFAVSSTLFFAGSLFFLGKEWFWMEPPGWLPWPFLTGIVLVGVTVLGTRRLHDRTAVWIGGVLLGEGLSLILHRREMSPLLLGDSIMRDFLWSGLSGLVFFHCARNWAADFLRRFQLFGANKGKE
ncbi:YphA family membrane protein [Salinithrix halophila]|uniref:VanZ like family protein n=1 Tax=Salinithrix halophila TaxID=1485204 RepID=A0ABV8JHN9_9BACL